MNSVNNSFKQAMMTGEQQVGGWCMSGSATLAEAMSYVGYDYLVLDLEHGPSTTQDALNLLRAVEQTETRPVVRMASHDPIAIKQILDIGAQTLYFPFVESVPEAEAIVNAAWYQPHGNRGFAKMHRASHYAVCENYTDIANEQLCLIAQLESPGALDLAVDIGSVHGIDAVFIGPGDLSSAMGLPGQVNHPDVQERMAACVKQCNTHNIPIGTVVPSPENAQWALEVGFNFVSIANDLANLMNTCKAQWGSIQALRQSGE